MQQLSYNTVAGRSGLELICIFKLLLIITVFIGHNQSNNPCCSALAAELLPNSTEDADYHDPAGVINLHNLDDYIAKLNAVPINLRYVRSLSRLNLRISAGLSQAAKAKTTRVADLRRPLAVRGNRVDPLNHFHKYRGGFNLKGKHYLASTLFTGVHGYLLGLVWLLAGAAVCCVRLCTCAARSTRRRRKMMIMYTWHPSSPKSISLQQLNATRGISTLYTRVTSSSWLLKMALLILATLLTALIIACCGVVFVGNQMFHTKAKQVERTIIVEGAENATKLISNVTQMMVEMKVDIEAYDKSVAKGLNDTTTKLNEATSTLVKIVHTHKSSTDFVFKSMNIGVHLLSTLNILLWSCGLACAYLYPRARRLFLLIIVLTWFVIFLNWVAFGFSFAISNFADDMCEALIEYQENPGNTTLDSVLPCNELASGSKTIFKLRQRIYEYIEQANANITRLNTQQQQQSKLKQEQQEIRIGDEIPKVCNPFSGPPSYGTLDSCSEGTISISILPELLSSLKCEDANITLNSSSLTCIPVKQYNIASAYIAATGKLLSSLPEIQNLTNCSFVSRTFTIIVTEQCKPVKHAIRVLWIALAILSALTTTTMFLWLLRYSLGKRLEGSNLLDDQHEPLPQDMHVLSPR